MKNRSYFWVVSLTKYLGVMVTCWEVLTGSKVVETKQISMSRVLDSSPKIRIGPITYVCISGQEETIDVNIARAQTGLYVIKKAMNTYVQKIDLVKDQGTKSDLVETLGDLGERAVRSCCGRHCGGG